MKSLVEIFEKKGWALYSTKQVLTQELDKIWNANKDNFLNSVGFRLMRIKKETAEGSGN